MVQTASVTILCLASYFKGASFLVAAKQAGARVLLVTREKLHDEPWPWESIDEVFYMPSLIKRPDIVYAVSYLMRNEAIDRIIPLDDYDVETAAHLREHLRLDGLSESTSRFFRDKLAMRLQAQAHGLAVPAFTAVFNYDKLRDFMQRVEPPWLLKPRSEAGAMGIKKVHAREEVWRWLDQLGDEQSFFLLEQFLPGQVYHVDAIMDAGQVVFAVPHQYGRPPMSVAHQGGVFVTHRLPNDDPDARQLLALNQELLTAFGLQYGASHTEFLKSDRDGRFYFVETAARVGGANIEQLVEAASGINLWGEWARLETALVRGEPYAVPQDKGYFAGLLVCLARQEYPDLSNYQAPEVVFRLHKKQHAGIVVASPDATRVQDLLSTYSQRFAQDFLAVAPPLDKPPT